MKILAIEKDVHGVKSDDFTPKLLQEETRHVLQLYLNDVLREIYFDDSHNAVLILECRDIFQAKEIVDNLPLVRDGLISFDIKTLNPYTGFSRLLQENQ